MSTKEWKNKELMENLSSKFGIKMDLGALKESKEITHMCALHVTHKVTGKEGHPIAHTLSDNGDISHYTVEFEDVIVENIAVGDLKILVQEEHRHNRDDMKDHDESKPKLSEEELEMVDCGDKGRVPKYACDGKGAKDLKEQEVEEDLDKLKGGLRDFMKKKMGEEDAEEEKDKKEMKESQLVEMIKKLIREELKNNGNK